MHVRQSRPPPSTSNLPRRPEATTDSRTAVALAVDLDRTLAFPGHPPPKAGVRALRDARQMGLKVILVSGRGYAALGPFADALGEIDALVAENGAVIEAPRGRRRVVLGRKVGSQVRQRLAREPDLRVEYGEIVVSVRREDRGRVERRLAGLPISLIENVDRVMVLPNGITKSFGVQVALNRMGQGGRAYAAIGDGENDLPMLRDAALSAAVANATPAARSVAGYQCSESGARGVAEFVRGPLSEWLIGPPSSKSPAPPP